MDQNAAFIYAKTEIGEYGMDKWQWWTSYY